MEKQVKRNKKILSFQGFSFVETAQEAEELFTVIKETLAIVRKDININGQYSETFGKCCGDK